jgi:ribonucleoside-diphosphate reductase alpha chain
MNLIEGCRYNDNPGFLETKYGNLTTSSVSSKNWYELGEIIRETKLLRNCSTIALPPTGRSGLVIDASTGVEPLFTLQKSGSIHQVLYQLLKHIGCDSQFVLDIIEKTGSCQSAPIPENIKVIFKTATEITPQNQLLMISYLNQGVDESISKTINMNHAVTVEEVEEVFITAMGLGLKGITVYRNGSLQGQPNKLVK